MFKTVTFNIQHHLYEKLRALAYDERTTISSLLRTGAEHVIDERDNSKNDAQITERTKG